MVCNSKDWISIFTCKIDLSIVLKKVGSVRPYFHKSLRVRQFQYFFCAKLVCHILQPFRRQKTENSDSKIKVMSLQVQTFQQVFSKNIIFSIRTFAFAHPLSQLKNCDCDRRFSFKDLISFQKMHSFCHFKYS